MSAAAPARTAATEMGQLELSSLEKEIAQAKERDPETMNQEARWRPALNLSCHLVVDLPLPNFRVIDFLRLQKGAIIATAWRITRDVPLRVNGTLIGWGEFDGSGPRLGVRLTELA